MAIYFIFGAVGQCPACADHRFSGPAMLAPEIRTVRLFTWLLLTLSKTAHIDRTHAVEGFGEAKPP